jgi:S-adenosylmethionine decarboxylase
MDPIGTHILYTIRSPLLNSLEVIIEALDKICDDLRFTVLNRSHHIFSPTGITAIYLLSESHISIHTWPDKSTGFIDVFCCRILDSTAIATIRGIIDAGLECSSVEERVIIRE